MKEEDVLECGDLAAAGQSAAEFECRTTQQPAGRIPGEEDIVLAHRIGRLGALESLPEPLQVSAAK